MLLNLYGKDLTEQNIHDLENAAKHARINALTMVQVANSGHPGGAFSSMEMFLSVYGFANLTPANASDLNRDYVIVSHGHTSAGVYAALIEYGFLNEQDALPNFRRYGSIIQGHIVREIPGIDWDTGNLGQGLSAGVGYALAQRARNYNGKVFVLMGDGGQTKGQIAEARRVAVKENLNNVIALIDWNKIQLSGTVEEILHSNIKELWEADGWETVECDGHSFKELFAALKNAGKNGKPTVILCRTVMGKDGGVMEGVPTYHGKAPGKEIYDDVVKALGGNPDILDKALEARKNTPAPKAYREIKPYKANIEIGTPIVYGEDKKSDNRGAFGKAIADVGKLNYKVNGKTPILVFDCDLSPSVMTGEFKKVCPDEFIQCGIQEHAVGAISGAAAAGGTVSVWAEFGVFGIDEAYNQQRLNDINKAGNKLVLTHVGLDVGEDGETHQCIDYVSQCRNMFGWKLLVPADPNQTDKATRYMLKEPGCICLAVGRSKVDSIPEFANPDYKFEYGKAVKLRDGNDGAIFALGYLTQIALKAADELAKQGVKISVYCVSSPLVVDMDALKEACKTGYVLTAEDHHVETGMGSILGLAMARNNLNAKLKNLGVSEYGWSGKSDDLRKAAGLDSEGLVKSFIELRK